MGRLIDIENIDYVRLEDSLHCLEHHKGDEVECVICAPTVEAIPKSDYENRLKADMVAMLTDMLIDVEEIESREQWCDYANDNCISRYDVEDLFQQKINSLKEA